MTIKIKDNLKRILNIALSILSFIIIIVLLRWAGIKGIISFIAGMTLMGYLLLSNNLMMRSLITIFGANKNLKEIMDEK